MDAAASVLARAAIHAPVDASNTNSSAKHGANIAAHSASDANAAANDAPRELQMHRIDFNPAQQLELKLINTLDVPSNSPAITHLSLKDCELSPNFMTRMYSVLNCFPALTRLDISNCYIERATARLLPGVAAALPNLVAFSARSCSMNDSCSCYMRGLLIACPRISNFSLENNNMTSLGEDFICDALTQVNSPASSAIARFQLSSRLCISIISGSGIAFDSPSSQVITLSGRSLSRGLSAAQRGLLVDIDLRHSSFPPAAAADAIIGINSFSSLRRLSMHTPDFDALLAVGIFQAFLKQPASQGFEWYGGRNYGEIGLEKQTLPEDMWLYRGSLLALNKSQSANGAPWSLVAHATASNLKSIAPCLIQDLCSVHASFLFDSCGRRACRRMSIGYCLLSSSFFDSFLNCQSSLQSLKDIIFLDCIIDAPTVLLHKMFAALIRLPALRQFVCGGSLWSLINDTKAVSELLSPSSPLLKSNSNLEVLNTSWLPISHVMLCMDISKIPYLNDLSTFAAQDWSYPPVAQSYSAFERAAAAVASCLNLATQTAKGVSNEGLDDATAGIEVMMHSAEATLMQALAPARVKAGTAITMLLNQLNNLTTLCLPNSIPVDNSTFDNLNAIARLTNLTHLNLDYNPFCSLGEPAASALVTCLSALSRIERLSLCGCCLSIQCFEQLHSLVFISQSGLVDLRLSFNSELGCSKLTRKLPQDLPRLKVLKLASVMMNEEDTVAVILSAVEHCSSLKTLDITSNGIPPIHVINIAQEKIEHLLYGVAFHIGVAQEDLVADHDNSKSIAVKFDMEKLSTMHSSLRFHLEQVHKIYPTCQALVLDGVQYQTDSFSSKKLMVASIFTPIRCLASRLLTLVLRYMDIGPGLSHAVAAHLTQLSNLVHFDYFGNYAGSEGMYSICRALAHTPNLQHLDLGCNHLNSEGVHFVVYALSSLPLLRSLHLAAPPSLTPLEHREDITLGDTGLRVLCKGIAATVAHTSMTALNLEGASSGAVGMEALSSCISNMRSLICLNISHNRITPQCSASLTAALSRLSNMVTLNMDGCFDSVHGTQDMCLNVLSCIYAMPFLRSFSCGFNLEEVDMRLMLGHVPHQTTTQLSLGVPLPREYICSRLPAYTNLQSLTWCIASLTEKQQLSFSKTVAALFGNGLSHLTIFCDSRRPVSESALNDTTFDSKQFVDASDFSIKGIVAAASAAKSLKEVNFIRISLSGSCVSSVLDAPTRVQQCLKFHACNWLAPVELVQKLRELCFNVPDAPFPQIPSTTPKFKFSCVPSVPKSVGGLVASGLLQPT